MHLNGSCCWNHEQSAAVIPVLPYSLGQMQRLVSAMHQVDLQSPAFSGSFSVNVFAAPPPKFPPGGASVLRI
jgi:hypothetical protein